MSGAQTTDPGNRSSADIEREVESTRADLNQTLEELRDRAQPGRLFEDALSYARSSGGADFIKNLGASLRDNPLPVLLIGAGVGWMMLSDGGRDQPSRSTGGVRTRRYQDVGASHHYGESDYGSTTRSSHGATGMAERASELAGAARERAGNALSSVGAAGQRAGDAARDAGEWIGSTASEATDRLTRATHDVRDRVADWSEATGDLQDRARENIGWIAREQPLVLGAVGVALGAAIGALLPSTEAENRLMGETRDQAADTARGLLRDGVDRARDVASRTLGDATQGMGENTDDAASKAEDAVRRVARQARETVRDVAQGLGSEARAALGDAPASASGEAEPGAGHASGSGSDPARMGAMPQPVPSGPQHGAMKEAPQVAASTGRPAERRGDPIPKDVSGKGGAPRPDPLQPGPV